MTTYSLGELLDFLPVNQLPLGGPVTDNTKSNSDVAESRAEEYSQHSYRPMRTYAV